MSLREFAERGRYKCFVCSIPEREEIEDAWASGVRTALIMRWLTGEKGYDEDAIPSHTVFRVHFDHNHIKRPRL